MTAQYRVMLKMNIRPGMEDEFEKTWREVGTSVTDFYGNRGQWLARSLDEDGVYYVTSDWTDEVAFREFETSERHLHHRERLHPFRSSGAMSLLRIVAAMPPRVTDG
jgi:heme-degrading monooxygenase HmoA